MVCVRYGSRCLLVSVAMMYTTTFVSPMEYAVRMRRESVVGQAISLCVFGSLILPYKNIYILSCEFNPRSRLAVAREL
jgi:hypothetical protein